LPTSKTWSVSARWIVPGKGRPIRNGVMRGRGGDIVAVGKLKTIGPSGNHRDLGQGSAVLPGLINAHTHLELTHLRGQLPHSRSMTQWLFALLHRRATGKQLSKSVRQGAAEALASGTTALGDISHNNKAWQTLKTFPLRKVCFAEVTGIGPLAGAAMGRLKKNLTGVRKGARLRFGISPHAPYSTAEKVYVQAVALAQKRNMIVSTHLAETEAERQFTLRGSGKFFEFLAHLGLIDSSVGICGCTPLAFARRVGLFDGQCILAHVNCIDSDEFQILRASGASVAYCPRSNDFFRRGRHRYAQMLKAGINVCLGTDSLASNSSLEMIEEMRRVRADGRVGSDTILRMATINGAKALGWDDQIGSLEPGKQADWIAVDVPPDAAHPVEALLTTDARVQEVVIAAKTCYTRED